VNQCSVGQSISVAVVSEISRAFAALGFGVTLQISGHTDKNGEELRGRHS